MIADILAALVRINEKGPLDARHGLCYNLYRLLPTRRPSEVDLWLERQFLALGLSPLFPVVHPDHESSEVAYNQADDLWYSNKGGSRGDVVYRRRRWGLVSQLIAIARREAEGHT